MKLILLILAGGVGFAQGNGSPAIAANGIVNGASFLDPRTTGGALAQGSLFSIIGSGLGPGIDADYRTGIAGSAPYGSSLAGVSVSVTQGGAAVDAWVLFAWTNQVNAILPSNAPLGNVQVRVRYNGRSSPPAPAVVTEASFGILSAIGGFGPGLIPGNRRATPARPAQIVTLLGTGLGPIDAPDNIAPGRLPVESPVEIYVGDKVVSDLIYAGRGGDLPAIDELTFQLPDDAPNGCYVPVQVRTGSHTYSNIVTMAVDADGLPCTERLDPFARTVLTGGRVGIVELLRLSLRAILEDGKPTVDVPAIDLGEAAFFQGAGDDPGLNPLYARPPAGLCTGAPPVSVLNTLLLPGSYGRTLSAGPAIFVTGAAGTIELKPQTSFPDEYYALLGGQNVLQDGSPLLPLFLTGGQYQVTGNGGKDVGAFRAQTALAPALTWTNRDAIDSVDRAAGLTVEWTGGDPASQAVVVFGGAGASTSGGGFLCIADVGAGTFTVPPRVLATVPPVDPLQPMAGFVMIGAIPAGEPAAKFAANGIDAGYVINAAVRAKQVGFR